MTQRGLGIVHLLDRSEHDQSIRPRNNGFGDINMEGDDMPTTVLTNKASIHDVGDNIHIENHTDKTSTSCQSGQDTDSTFSSSINIDDITIQNVITDQAERDSKLSTDLTSSGPTENISIDDSDGNGTQGHRHFVKSMISALGQ